MNTTKVSKRGRKLSVFGDTSWPAGAAATNLADGEYTIGLRPHHVTPGGDGAATGKLRGRVLVTEISGSESVIHLDVGGETWVSQSHGIHRFDVGSTATLHADVDRAIFFDSEGVVVR
jgi:glycerol transport system ATP-binding protein